MNMYRVTTTVTTYAHVMAKSRSEAIDKIVAEVKMKAVGVLSDPVRVTDVYQVPRLLDSYQQLDTL